MTTTPPPGVKPRPTVIEETAASDVVMVDAELREENVGREEEARNRPEEARELGIARAVITRETRPKPVEQWLEMEIGGKIFKLGRPLEVELQDQIAKVIGRHLDAFARCGLGGVVHYDRQVQVKAESREVHLWRGGWEVLGVPLN